jgi:hypothetical protein
VALIVLERFGAWIATFDAIKRMPDYREQRRAGWRCVRVALHDGNIKMRVEKGYLKPEFCDNQDAIELAIDGFLNESS